MLPDNSVIICISVFVCFLSILFHKKENHVLLPLGGIIGILLKYFGIIEGGEIDHILEGSMPLFMIIAFVLGGMISIDKIKQTMTRSFSSTVGEYLIFIIGMFGILFTYFYMSIPLIPAVSITAVLVALALENGYTSVERGIWKNRAAGKFSIILLNDAKINKVVFAFFAVIVIGGISLLNQTGSSTATLITLGYSIGLGLGIAILIEIVLRKKKNTKISTQVVVILLFGVQILLVLSLPVFGFVSALCTGIIIGNRLPKRSENFFNALRGFTPFISVYYMIVAGVFFTVDELLPIVLITVGIYIVGRLLMKYGVTYLFRNSFESQEHIVALRGIGSLSHSALPLILVMVLALEAPKLLLSDGGRIVMYTSFLVIIIHSILGHLFLSIALKKAGDKNRIRTEFDILESLKAEDIMQYGRECVESMSIENVVDKLVHSDFTAIPVITNDKKLVGEISFIDLRESLIDRSNWSIMIVSDFMRPPSESVEKITALSDVVQLMDQLNVKEVPVLDNGTYCGIANRDTIESRVRQDRINPIS